MHSYVQFITTPTADTPGTTLLLHFDSKRYIIGRISEGTQRASIQRAARLTKVTDIFLTGKTEWQNTGGLLGMILTLADSVTAAAASEAQLRQQEAEKRLRRLTNGETRAQDQNGVAESGYKRIDEISVEKPSVTVHGGKNITHTFATARRFIFRQGLPVSVEEYEGKEPKTGWEPTWTDENIKVWAMSVSPSSNGVALPAQQPNSPRKRSYDDFKDRATESSVGTTAHLDTPAEQRDRAQQMRNAVVSEMFDSAWRLDALIECPLGHVRLPAALFVRNPETRKIEKYTGPLPGGDEPLPDITVLIRKPWPGALIESLPPTQPSHDAMSYIIRNHPQRGRFLPDKARALNIKRGHKFSQLAAGQDVLSEDGKTVTPEMVLGPGKEGGGVAIVDLPTADYLDNLIARPEWRTPEVMVGVGAIIWILGPGVGQDERLHAFVKEFPQLKHLVSSLDACPNYLAFDSAAAAAIQLNQADPIRFPIPVHDNVTLPQSWQPNGASSGALDSRMVDAPLAQAQRGQMLQLEPLVEVKDHLVVAPLNTALILERTCKEVRRLGQEAREELAQEDTRKRLEDEQAHIPSKDAEIITLGTGSASPSKYRNVSSTLLRVPGYGSYLLDCGENTLGQLKRVFTPDELAEVLRDLKLIWISHLHADHHLGTTSVIKAWYQEVHGGQSAGNPMTLTEQLLHPAKILQSSQHLFVASEKGMIHWLSEYASVEDYGFRQLVPLAVSSYRASNTGPVEARNSTTLTWDERPISFRSFDETLNKALTTATGLADLQAVRVNHCSGAHAVSLTFPNGFKFSYSGDCRPSRAFAEIGRGSTVLLHEATFEDELHGDALAKKHSTTSEALGVGAAMGASRVLLTHFSQRYQKIPNIQGLERLEVGLEEAEGGGEEGAAGGDVEMGDASAGVGRSGGWVGSSAPAATARSQGTRTTKARPPVRDMKVGVAFDYMRVKVGEIAHLERFGPALSRLFEVPETVVEGKVGDEGGKAKEKEKGKGTEKNGKKGKEGKRKMG